MKDFDEMFKKLEDKLESFYVKATGKTPEQAITNEQRKKVYAMVRRLAQHTGYSDADMKIELKRKFCEAEDIKEFSLSNCKKNTAHDFIDFILLEMVEHGVEFSPEDIQFYEKTVRFVLHMVREKKCIVCGKDARESKYNMRPFTLCEGHIPEWSKDKEAFIRKYHFHDYFHGMKQ